MSQLFDMAHSAQDLHEDKSLKKEKFISSFEKLLTLVNSDGPYQRHLLFYFIIPFVFFYGIAGMGLYLLLTTPTHSCHVPGIQNTNFSLPQWQNETIPWEKGSDGIMKLNQCEMYKLYNKSADPLQENSTFEIDSSEIIQCEYGWDYSHKSWTETPITQFDWVCDASNKVTTMFTIHLAGCAVGTFTFSILSDRYGRLPMFYLTLFLCCFFGSAIVLAPSFLVFAIFKFLQALAFYTLFQMPFIIASEISGPRLRSITTMGTFISFTLASVVVSSFAWLLDYWKWFQLATVLPVSLFALLWRYIPESPRWLLSQGKIKKCEKIMKKIAKVNGTEFTPEMKQLLLKAEEEEKINISPLKIFSTRVMSKHLFLVSFLSCLSYAFGVGLSLNIHNMKKGNEIISYVVLNLFDIPGTLIGGLTADYLGRRASTIMSSTLSAVNILIASFVVTEFWPSLIFCGLSKMFNGAVVLAVYHQTAELFPTSLRATAYGITGIAGMTATIAVPKLISLGASNIYVPYYIMSCIGIIEACTATFLPETVGSALPQTFKEANEIGYNQRYFTFIHRWNAHKYYPVQNEEREQNPPQQITLLSNNIDQRTEDKVKNTNCAKC